MTLLVVKGLLRLMIVGVAALCFYAASLDLKVVIFKPKRFDANPQRR